MKIKRGNDGFYHYINNHGYEHCDHKNSELIKVVTAWGNASFICRNCGWVAKKELTSTAL